MSVGTDRSEFLRELTALSHKYGITIGACGCCSSPWLNDMEKCEVGWHYKCDIHTGLELEWCKLTQGEAKP